MLKIVKGMKISLFFFGYVVEKPYLCIVKVKNTHTAMIKTIDFAAMANKGGSMKEEVKPSRFDNLVRVALNIEVSKENRKKVVDMVARKMEMQFYPDYVIENLTFLQCCHIVVAAKYKKKGIEEFLYDYADLYEDDEKKALRMEKFMGEVAKAYEKSRELLYKWKMNNEC